ncbi:MAG: hypothetical protein U5K38_14395 [Woeseiaceae bacterium]|nr:hypothetical protein [Woeseiaceae bacterium]
MKQTRETVTRLACASRAPAAFASDLRRYASYPKIEWILKTARSTKMTKYTYALAGIFFGGVGLFLGIAMSSSISGTASMYGSVAAIYAAVAAAILAGVKKKGASSTPNRT